MINRAAPSTGWSKPQGASRAQLRSDHCQGWPELHVATFLQQWEQKISLEQIPGGPPPYHPHATLQYCSRLQRANPSHRFLGITLMRQSDKIKLHCLTSWSWGKRSLGAWETWGNAVPIFLFLCFCICASRLVTRVYLRHSAQQDLPHDAIWLLERTSSELFLKCIARHLVFTIRVFFFLWSRGRSTRARHIIGGSTCTWSCPRVIRCLGLDYKIRWEWSPRSSGGKLSDSDHRVF